MQTAGIEVSNDALPTGGSSGASQKENLEHLLRALAEPFDPRVDRKSTRLNSSHH